jgi:predicted 3-demethylubiquinone-9 3-methyltransferase (glyoxalase superfamily)
MQKVITFLWFKDDRAEEAVNFYVSVIKGAKITEIMRSGKAGPGPAGSVVTVEFEIGGQKVQCGWLTDKFGVSWQIVTPLLREMLNDKDPAKSERVMRAMMGMTKIEMDGIRRAYEG